MKVIYLCSVPFETVILWRILAWWLDGEWEVVRMSICDVTGLEIDFSGSKLNVKLRKFDQIKALMQSTVLFFKISWKYLLRTFFRQTTVVNLRKNLTCKFKTLKNSHNNHPVIIADLKILSEDSFCPAVYSASFYANSFHFEWDFSKNPLHSLNSKQKLTFSSFTFLIFLPFLDEYVFLSHCRFSAGV